VKSEEGKGAGEGRRQPHHDHLLGHLQLGKLGMARAMLGMLRREGLPRRILSQEGLPRCIPRLLPKQEIQVCVVLWVVCMVCVALLHLQSPGVCWEGCREELRTVEEELGGRGGGRETGSSIICRSWRATRPGPDLLG